MCIREITPEDDCPGKRWMVGEEDISLGANYFTHAAIAKDLGISTKALKKFLRENVIFYTMRCLEFSKNSDSNIYIFSWEEKEGIKECYEMYLKEKEGNYHE